MRILMVGAGVIGSVYAGALAESGHSVAMLARGHRLDALRDRGLVLVDAGTGEQNAPTVAPVATISPEEAYDLVVVAVREDQLDDVAPALRRLPSECDMLFFGNTANRTRWLSEALEGRAFFGFPAVGGVRDADVVRYVLIPQQRTMLGEVDGHRTARLDSAQAAFEAAGFRTRRSDDIEGWLLGHAAFIVPIGVALLRHRGDAARLAADGPGLRRMVRATRQAFRALGDRAEVPGNLRALYRLPDLVVTRYWRRVLAGPRGELWFAAHTRAAPEEIASLARALTAAVTIDPASAPDLAEVLTGDRPASG
ncbi:ketopantoate reductase family protein [Micropruina glycogenica]|uniref:Putative Ketopantoate reductase n=1 Tax=Micropruina glycogenica TaxID=75385 RepID=A0A2N9JEJ6_9ACTN|nr:2-dehydropantoate 2-reductase N-terminal domain-containing protein [Micropruina glycogenica]SPD85959.1 putative Ketopantoate reductase [Micropruina glycogenica]